MNANEIRTLAPQGAIEFLNLTAIKDEELYAEAKKLDELQTKLLSHVGLAIHSGNEIRKEQAAIIANIANGKLYAKDGFKSIEDFGESIGLGRSTAYQLASAGKIYNDESAPEQLKALSPANLSTLAASIRADKDRIYADAKAGVFDNLNQAELKQKAAKYREDRQSAKPRVETTYIAYYLQNGHKVELVTEEPSPNGDYTLKEWESAFKSNGGELIKLPNAKVSPDAKKATVHRYLLVEGNDFWVLKLLAYEPRKNGEVQTSNPREHYIEMARAQGATVEEVNRTCSVMGWNTVESDWTDTPTA